MLHVEWYGQSAFRLTDGSTTVFIDPFPDMSAMTGSGMRWDYPAITGVDAHLLLVTHEHIDHNGIDVIDGDPVLIRSAAGTHESPIGEVVSVASEHDDVAGTARGANTMLVFSFGGARIAHLGDLGQPALRPEQLAALGKIDLLFVPVGGMATIDAEVASAVSATLGAKVIVPMHYRSERIDFLEPVDGFLERAARVERPSSPGFDLEALPAGDGPLVVVPAVP
jgi:L-ascorbate metabolism protein UlaG (beta-lactamase superfamily)